MEFELKYNIKEREEDILADTMAMPFQPVKQFGTIKEGEWHNMLIFGDNLQALKYLKKLQDEGKLEKIKLIYIDPPFGTGDIYDAKGEPAYSAAMKGAEFVEFLRKRLIFLREILADDGSIYLRIDYHFGHYIKVIMDEIFGYENFRNEINIKRGRMHTVAFKRLVVANESLFFYTKSSIYTFHAPKKVIKEPKWEEIYQISKAHKVPDLVVFGRVFKQPDRKKWSISQSSLDLALSEGRVRLRCPCGYLHYKGNWTNCPNCGGDKPVVEVFKTQQPLNSDWTDILSYSTFSVGYPSQNSEVLLERVIKASSNPGDLVLDCFAGSGTTGAVAEKLGRRWIMVDSSKLAIYTIIKRLHNLKKEIGNKGEPLKPKPFVLYKAQPV